MSKELIPIHSFEQLQSLRASGIEILAPAFGVQSVTSGQIEVWGLDESVAHDTYFVQVADGGQQAKMLLFRGDKALQFVTEWVDSYIDYTDYSIELLYQAHYLTKSQKSPISSDIDRPYVSRIANSVGEYFGIEVESKDPPDSTIKLFYKTRCESTDQKTNSDELKAFREKADLFFKAMSIDSGLGFILLSEHITGPKTFWRTGPWVKEFDVNMKNITGIIEQLKGSTRPIHILATLNSITSSDAQIIYGFEMLKQLLQQRVEDKLKSTFELNKSQRRQLARVTVEAAQKWMEGKGLEWSDLQRERLHGDMHQTLQGTTPAYNLALEELLHDILGGEREDIKHSLKQLKEYRHYVSHSSSKIIDSAKFEESIDFVRLVLKSLC